jgi:2-dehydropantoate 2-reductase
MAPASHKMKITVMGTGGLGGYFGGMLARAGEDVTFIARGKHLQAMREHGLQVLSPHGDFLINPVQATDTPDQVGIADLILFCVKSYDAEVALQLIKPMIGPDTVVIPVLNGVEHVTTMQAALGEQFVLGGLSTVNAHKSAPGVVRHTANAGSLQLEFGEWPEGISPRCERIQAVLTEAGLLASAVANVSESMWGKLAVMSGAGVLAVMRGSAGSIWSSEAEAMLQQAIAEAVAVVAAEGIALPNTLPNTIVGLGIKRPDFKPSLLLDLEHGNPLELEAITGLVRRLGKKANIPTPVNDFVYACLKPYMNGSSEASKEIPS